MAEPAKKQSLLTLLQEHISSANIGETSVLMAYYLLLSIFPLMLALGNILPLFNIDPETILPYLAGIVPEAVQSILTPIVEHLLTSGNGGLFSLGMVVVIWSASNGIHQLEKGLNHAYGIVDTRHNIVKRAVAVVVVIVVLLLAVALVIVFGLDEALFERLAATIPAAAQVAGSLSGLKWPVSVVILLCVLLLLYMWAPSAKVRVRDALPGTVFAAIGWILLVFTFSLYLQFAVRSLSMYGVLSSLFILMFWLNFACILVLLGAVLNATLYKRRHGELIMKKHTITQKLSDKLEDFFKKFARKKNHEEE